MRFLKEKNKDVQDEISPLSSQIIKAVDKIQIQEGSEIQSNDQKVYGIYEPANYNFSLNRSTKADDLWSSLKRLEKIKLFKIIK